MNNREQRLQKQIEAWPSAVAEARKHGNPLATLCLHCYGRHAPPNDDLCPHDPPPSAKSIGFGEN